MLESVAGAPWCLAERCSALDIYVCAMTRWRPKREWFARNAPHVAAITARKEQHSALAVCWRRNQLGA